MKDTGRPIPAKCRQLLLVTSVRWQSNSGTLCRYIRRGLKWNLQGSPWPVMLGRKGMAQGNSALKDQGLPWKKEGDLKSPAGIYSLGVGFGQAAGPPQGSRWPYRQAEDDLLCVDDTRSRYYNRFIRGRRVTVKDWRSAEKLNRRDGQYDWALVINHNTSSPKPGRGSCIFLHIWKRKGNPTAGCTAMSRKHMEDLIRWLDPALSPRLIQVPRQIYPELNQVWALP